MSPQCLFDSISISNQTPHNLVRGRLWLMGVNVSERLCRRVIWRLIAVLVIIEGMFVLYIQCLNMNIIVRKFNIKRYIEDLYGV